MKSKAKVSKRTPGRRKTVAPARAPSRAAKGGRAASRQASATAPRTPKTTGRPERPAAKPAKAKETMERARRAMAPPSAAPATGAPRTRSERVPAPIIPFVEPATEARGKYVYCVIPAKEALRFGAMGIGDEQTEVHTINYRNIAAVVSDTRIEAHEPTRENVLAHEHVNEIVMRNHTVIPMSFGTVFKTREDIIELLRSAYDAFHDVLLKMQDKLEFGLKVLWDREIMIREIEDEDDDIRRLKEEISSQKGSTYFARMQYGRLVDAALQARSERYVSDIFERLRDVAVASRANKPIGDKMIMNAAFLVFRDSETAFDARVKEIGQKYDKLTFRFTGPWPPYNFVNIRLKLERAKEPE